MFGPEEESFPFHLLCYKVLQSVVKLKRRITCGCVFLAHYECTLNKVNCCMSKINANQTRWWTMDKRLQTELGSKCTGSEEFQ
jgi:hypothetical protein